MKSRGHIKNCFYMSAVNRIDHQSNDHPQDVFPPPPHTIPRISIWFQWFVIALPHSELQLLWHSHQNFIAYLINYFCKEVHFPPKRLPHSITTKSEKKLKLCEVLPLNCGVVITFSFISDVWQQLHQCQAPLGDAGYRRHIQVSSWPATLLYLMLDDLWCKNSTKW